MCRLVPRQWGRDHHSGDPRQGGPSIVAHGRLRPWVNEAGYLTSVRVVAHRYGIGNSYNDRVNGTHLFLYACALSVCDETSKAIPSGC